MNKIQSNDNTKSELPIHEQNFKKIKKYLGEECAKGIKAKCPSLMSVSQFAETIKFADADLYKDGTALSYLHTHFIRLGNLADSDKDPFQLLEEAGYEAFYADTQEKQDSIEGYFKDGSTICTIGSNRFQTHHIIHAVKKNAKELEPARDPDIGDEYATSVISIQIPKQERHINNIKITNRYNHVITHQNTDQTFHNNPDEIIAGLTKSICRFFEKSFKDDTTIILRNSYTFQDDRLLKYNIYHGIGPSYFGNNFYVKNSKFTELKKCGDIFYEKDKVKKYQKEQEILMDDIILKIYREKPVEVDGKLVYGKFAEFIDIDNPQSETVKLLNQEIADKTTVRVQLNKDKTQSISFGKIDEKTNKLVEKEFVRLKDSNIIKINLEKATILPDSFLQYNQGLEEVNFANIEEIGHAVLEMNTILKNIYIPKVTKIGHCFLYHNKNLKEIKIPELISVGSNLLAWNEDLEKAFFPKLKNIGMDFLLRNIALREIDLSSAENIDSDCLRNNKNLKRLYLPNLRNIGKGFLDNHPGNFNEIIINKNVDIAKLKIYNYIKNILKFQQNQK